MLAKIVIISALAIAGFKCLDVDQCEGHHFKNLEDRIKVTGCEEPPCGAIKGKTLKIVMKFTPERDHDDVKNLVLALTRGLQLPFIGVSGVSICGNLYKGSNPQQKTSCPIKAHTEYVYKAAVPIVAAFPNWNVTVHWALVTPTSKTLICFEVPVAILNDTP